ncbi:hypothetical protein TIFTF001_037362 [Ficus carica]|uniref:Uncharacterized protein n=1 Tax=Ficus carica TaxID=3494 RepID=A0AA88E5F1_FICCA|nr:hypothetical protein TIFTF001_037362 [Ficus carica]
MDLMRMIVIFLSTLQRVIWWSKDVLTRIHCRGGCSWRRRRAQGAGDHEIRGNLNRDYDFFSILLSLEVIFIVEITITL